MEPLGQVSVASGWNMFADIAAMRPFVNDDCG
jgi:hypothetical protein